MGAGSGTEAGQRRNALSVSADGDTAIHGDLTVGGAITIDGESVLTLSVANASYLTPAAGDIRYVTKDEAQNLYLKIIDLQPALQAERATSDNRYHRKDQSLQVAKAAEFNGPVAAHEAAAFHKSVIINGEVDGEGTVRAKPGQAVLVPEQGDISMGEFRAGAQPVVAP